MQDSLYSAVFGALSNEHRMNLIANNLANVNSTGYKRDQVAFKDVFVPFAHDYILDSKAHLRAQPMWPDADVLAKPRLSEQRTDFSQGPLAATGNMLDVALQGEGFFKIMTPEGERYTRNGTFKLDVQGQMVDAAGNPLQGEGGPITVPPGNAVIIDQAGRVKAGDEVLGTIAVYSFENPRALEKVGGTMFRVREGEDAREVATTPGQPVADENGNVRTPVSVHQGYLESANVEVVTEMVRMIETQRVFEAYNKVMRGEQQLDGRLMSSMGKPV